MKRPAPQATQGLGSGQCQAGIGTVLTTEIMEDTTQYHPSGTVQAADVPVRISVHECKLQTHPVCSRHRTQALTGAESRPGQHCREGASATTQSL